MFVTEVSGSIEITDSLDVRDPATDEILMFLVRGVPIT